MNRTRARVRALLVAIAAATSVVTTGTDAGAGQGSPCNPMEPDPLFCPDPAPSSCVSHGVVVVERDLIGVVGDATVDQSQSRAWTLPAEGQPIRPPHDPGVFPPPPSDPSAHADAHQVGVSYVNTLLGLSLDTKNVHSWCDVAATFGPAGLETQAYGRAGVTDLSLTVGGNTLTAEALDFEINAFGFPFATMGVFACDVVELGLNPPPPLVSWCPAPFTSIGAFGIVTVTFNEQYGPTPAGPGRWMYSGDVMHVTVLLPGISQVDVYVGYVAVTVSGQNPQPPMWIPDPCRLPLGPVIGIDC